MKIVLLLIIVVIAGGAWWVMNAEPPQRTVQEQAFHDANSQITSDTGGVAYGNTAEAKAAAKAFSDTAGTLQQLMFSGGKENRAVSLTGEQFLTYCRLDEGQALFLVHVPQFKRYKDDVRETLLDMCWTCAVGSLPERYGEDTRLAIGLRGSLFYGGIVEGRLGDEAPTKTLGATVDDATLVAYFPQAVEPAAVAPVPAAVTPSPAEGPQPPPSL